VSAHWSSTEGSEFSSHGTLCDCVVALVQPAGTFFCGRLVAAGAEQHT